MTTLRTNLALATLFLGTFVMGSAELLVVGTLNLIATDLKISIPAAGTLVTAYALGLAIGGPILTALTVKLDKRTVLTTTLILFIAGNLIPILFANYQLFLAARVVTGALQGLFLAVAFVAGAAIVPPERAGRAISVVIAGFAASATAGLPLGALLGHAFGWRGSFTAITSLSAIALVAVLVLIPSVASTDTSAGSQARYAFAPRVLAILLQGFLLFAAVAAAQTYIVPFLEQVTGISGALISVFLLIYGAATVAGSFAGGRFADHNAARAMIVTTTGVAISLLALYFVGSVALLVALVMLAWGMFAMGTAPSFQYRTVSLAGPGAQLASSLPASAANAGIAFGSLAGGAAIGNFTVTAPVITGLIIAVITIPLAWATSFLKPPVVKEDQFCQVEVELPVPKHGTV